MLSNRVSHAADKAKRLIINQNVSEDLIIIGAWNANAELQKKLNYSLLREHKLNQTE